MCGHAGVYLVAALIRNIQGVSEATIEYAHKYEQLGQYAFASTFETDEVLYGCAGYLLGGLMLNQQAGKELVSVTSTIEYCVSLYDGTKQDRYTQHNNRRMR